MFENPDKGFMLRRTVEIIRLDNFDFDSNPLGKCKMQMSCKSITIHIDIDICQARVQVPNPLSQQVPNPDSKVRPSLKNPKTQFFGLG